MNSHGLKLKKTTLILLVTCLVSLISLAFSALPVAAISYGNEYTFNLANTTTHISVSALDSTHFVVAYQDNGNSDYGTAIIGTVSDGIISYGSEYVFNSADTCVISVSALDSTHFVVGYKDAGGGSYGHAKIGTISGNTISYGSEATFNSAFTEDISVSALDSTHFVVGYRDAGGGSYGHAKIGTVSGNTISYGSEYTFNSAVTCVISVSSLDSTHFVATYSDYGNNFYGTAIIGTVSGSTISYGSEYVFNSGITYYISFVSSLDSTHFVVTYRDNSNSDYGTAIIGTVSGSTISYGSEYVFNEATTDYISVSNLDSTHFVVGYKDTGGDTYGHTKIGTASDSTISYGSEYTFNSATTNNISVSTLVDSTHFVVAYQDTGGDTYGHAKIGTVTSTISDIPDWTGYGLWDNGNQLIGSGTVSVDTPVYIKDTSGNKVVEFNFTEDKSLLDVTVGSKETDGKAFIHGLGETGVANKKLYIKKLGVPTSVYVCPLATDLDSVAPTCDGGYTLTEGARLSQDDLYWVVSLLATEGTGAGNGVAGGEGEAVPEFTTLTFIIAAVAGFGIYMLIRRKNSGKAEQKK